MKAKMSTKLLSLMLCIALLVSLLPILPAQAYYEEPTADGNTELESVEREYSLPSGMTMELFTDDGISEWEHLGGDFLFVIKQGDRYYAMKDIAASEENYETVPAVDVTDWVNADGTVTIPADTLDVAFWRYEGRDYTYAMFINGRNDGLGYSEDYEAVDGDDDYYNDSDRIYSGEFKVRTYEEDSWHNTLYFYSENNVSGTLRFVEWWTEYVTSYYTIRHTANVVVDLRDDAVTGKEFYFRYLGTDVEYTGEEVEGYLYYSGCRHEYTVRHAEYDAPTCMLKGCEEYWYCEGCDSYLKNEELTESYGQEMPIIPATGHDFDNEKCKNCNRPVPVYSKVTNQAQFDALADDTMFILVAEYNGKHYVMDFSEVYSYMTDSDGDGYYDIHDVDADEDGIPDYLEFDEGGGGEWGDEPNGVYDYLEWDMDDDGDVDENDLLEFHYMTCDQHLTDMLYSNGSINATEITMNPDGTFSHEEAKKTAEFEMVDVYLAEDYDPEWHNHWENGEMPYHTKCVKQFVIPNYFLSAPSMRPIERMYQQRIYDFGDSSHWGVIFYDSREDYYSYVDGDMEGEKVSPLPFPDVNKEGSVAVFDTFDDIMWILYDEGQMAQLRLRDYNETIGFVTGHDYELEGAEWIYDESTGNEYYDTKDTQACVYLYASAQYNSHTCDFGEWKDNEDGRTHTGTCECGETKTENHGWNNGEETTAPTCTEVGVTTYTCNGCKATKTEDIDALDHDWSKWTYSTENSHIRTCNRDCGAEEEIGDHEWGDWSSVDGDNHKKTCPICSGDQVDEHDWDEGVVVEGATHTTVGTKVFTCTVCKDTYSEDIPTTDGHEWSEWKENDDGATHSRTCPCGESETLDHNFDDGVVVEEATHTETGIKTFTCVDCGYSYDEDIPTTDGHEWSEWKENDDGTTHSRTCPCGEAETLEHKYDDGVVVERPTHTETGIKTFTCGDCGYSYDEDIPVLTDHEWGEWVVNKVDEKNTHIHFCICNESETAPHNFDDGVVTLEATHTSKGVMTFTCGDCKYYYEEEIPETTEHEWTRWSPNDDGTHTRACRCNANETKDCTWDDGVITLEPTHFEEGEKTYTCTTCGNTKVEPIEKTTEHVWADWVGNNDGRTHTHECKCGETETLPHAWSSWTEQAAGGYQRVCTDCGASESMVLDEEKPVNTTPNDNAANSSLTNTDIELIDKVLTDEEQSQVATGADVSIYLVVEDISNNVPTDNKAAAEEEAKAEDTQIGMFLDIDLFKKVETVETQITETNGPVSITIQIPSDLINTDASIERTYKIIRVHELADGTLVTEVIEGEFNPQDNSFTFQTDKFSTYALAYADNAVEQDDPVEPDVPQTGDNNMIAMLLVSGLGLALIATFGKKRIFAK